MFHQRQDFLPSFQILEGQVYNSLSAHNFVSCLRHHKTEVSRSRSFDDDGNTETVTKNKKFSTKVEQHY